MTSSFQPIRLLIKHRQFTTLCASFGGLLSLAWIATASSDRHPSHATTEPAASPFSNQRTVSPSRRLVQDAKAVGTNPTNFTQWLSKLGSLTRLEDPSERQFALQRLIRDLSPEDAQALLASRTEQANNTCGTPELLEKWALADPRAAMEWAYRFHATTADATGMITVAVQWAKSDLFGSANWVKQLPQSKIRTELLSIIGHEMIQHDPVSALSFAEQIQDDALRLELMSRAVGDWAMKNVNQAITWATEITEPNLRNSLFERITYAALETDLGQAANLALNQMTESIEQDRALITIVQRWSAIDPLSTSAWVSQFPQDVLGVDAVDVLISAWVLADSHSADQWLRSLPQGEVREAGNRAYTRYMHYQQANLSQL